MTLIPLTQTHVLTVGDVVYEKIPVLGVKMQKVSKVTAKFFYLEGIEVRYSREGHITTDEYKRHRIYVKKIAA